MKFSVGALTALLAVDAAHAQGGILSSFFGSGAEADDAAAKNDSPGVARKLESADGSMDATAAAAASHHASRHLQAVSTDGDAYDYSLAEPAQTFYIPYPETDVQQEMFNTIQPGSSNGLKLVRGNMVSIISVAVSTDHTVIWYDHWEDAFEVDVQNPVSSDTEIWGDGDASNGCRPDVTKVKTCQDADDVLNAGDSFVIQDSMPIPRQGTGWMAHGIAYDGGDKVQASFPVTMSRGSYSEYPGSLLAGAVEILDTDNWGTVFDMPVGTNTYSETRSFEYTSASVMSGTNGNVVTLPDGRTTTLNEGQASTFTVKHGEQITSVFPVQVDIAAGDIGSTYEMRWYSLLATADWSDEYMTPVGDDYGNTKLIMYNPHSTSIQIRFEWRLSNGSMDSINYTIQPKSTAFTRVVPTGSGAIVRSTSGKTFMALSMTDAANQSGAGNYGGQAFDWGFPVVPKNRLTPQVLVGWGYGCTNNICDSGGQTHTERSAVWICPTEDADVYIDFQNKGSGYLKHVMSKLQSMKIRDTLDTDMSGALIFATTRDSGPSGPPVDIAAAWGQDPSVSISNQQLSLDLGTVVLPFSTIRVSKVVDKAVAKPGETLTYTITVQNVGQVEVKAGDYQIFDPLMAEGTYVEDTLQYSEDGGVSWFDVNDDDSPSATPFPLDEAGLASQADLPRRGGMHKLKFQVVINADTLASSSIVNTGYITPPTGNNLPFQAETAINYVASIGVSNFVYVGDNGKEGCGQATEEVTDVGGTTVTYCFKVTNTGPTHLGAIQLWNSQLGFRVADFNVPNLAPGESALVAGTGKITKYLRNVARVRGTATYQNGVVIPNVSRPTATDPSIVRIVEYSPQILIQNTVYTGHKGTDDCAVAGVEKAVGPLDTPVTYCFNVTNIGNTYLTEIAVVNTDLGYSKNDYISLGPGESVLSSTPLTITSTFDNMASATGTPAMPDLTAIPNMVKVTNSDPSGVQQTVDTDTKSGDKDPFVIPETCMQTNWADAGNKQDLVCRAKEVYVKDLYTERLSCDVNSMVKLNITANIHFNTARYDPAWYVATDGGDALVGQCALGALTHGNDYQVTQDQKSVGYVSWNQDFKGGNDKCGDVFIDGGGGADIMVPFVQNKEMKCVDHNNDGVMDFSVCFSWRVPGSDGFCTLSRDDPDTQGNQADAYPGTPSKCLCIRYDIPDITVITPDDDNHVSPC